MEKRQVPVRNGAFSIEVWEAGSGDPVLYLHGEGRPTWTPFLDTLAEQHRVIVPLHPGYGESSGNEQLGEAVCVGRTFRFRNAFPELLHLVGRE